MKLLQLLRDAGATPRYRLVASAALSALSSTLVLALVNTAAEEIASGQHRGVDWTLAALFLGCIGACFFGESYLIGRVSRDIERALHRLRGSLVDHLGRADLLQVERFGEGRLYQSITQTSATISRDAPYLAMNFRSIILVAAIMGYIGMLSWIALLLVVLVIVLAGRVYLRMTHRVQARYRDMLHQETQLFEGVTDLFDGFKEVRLSSTRSHDLGEAFGRVSEQARHAAVDVQGSAFQQSIFGQVAFFFLLGVIVFVAPAYSTGFSADVVKVTTAALFMIGPLSSVLQSVTLLASAEAAAAQMFQLDEQLQAMAEPAADDPARPDDDFEQLCLRDIAFAYPAADGERPFAIGPLELSLRPGEILFITGGNGSGKTTLVKLLAGLYAPQQGTIEIDGRAVGAAGLQRYREMIATVFSDYHLFRRFHGLGPLDLEYATSLLALLEMDQVTQLQAGGFTRVDLSAGQRKRLALIAALLERRPVLLLDEWAADQDPRFRRKFYRELLPRLRAEGRAVIAVTHDDHYFDVADRRLHLESGQLRAVLDSAERPS
ncbi:MAG: cyclic peptide export ABC transporter [Pseudomonas sp.]|uniref:cyclic peptide export ABC transporter n=1 Tax=Pseudomonas sp. TaxID=306 RepID=UPI0033927489